VTITVPEDGTIDIRIFEKLLDISKVVWYDFEVRDGCAAE